MSAHSQKIRRAIVLGAGGFIGGRLCESLRASREIEIHGLTSTDCNLTDAGAVAGLSPLIDPRCAVVVCAAVTRRRDDSWSAFQANIRMAHNLAGLFAKTSPRSVVFLSSTDVYGLPTAELPVVESTLTRPGTHYALAKLACESLLRMTPGRCWPLSIFRLPGVFGAGDKEESVIGRLTARLMRREPIPVTGDGLVRRDFLDVDDLLRLIGQCLQSPTEGTWNVATGQSRSIAELIEAIGGILGAAPMIEFQPPDVQRDHHLEFDISAICSAFPGWRPTALCDSLGKYVSSLRGSALHGDE